MPDTTDSTAWLEAVENGFGLADVAHQRREPELNKAEFEWSKAPEPLKPGYQPLNSKLATLCDLPDGFPVTTDEWLLLMYTYQLGLPAWSRGRLARAGVRPQIVRLAQRAKNTRKKAA